MELSHTEIMQDLDDLPVTEELRAQCRQLAAEGRYEELCLCLRRERKRFLQEMHRAQNDLDRLDRIIYDMKKRSRGDASRAAQTH